MSNMIKMKTLAISILNWNTINDTKICIDSLNKSIFQNFDIYLFDNWSKNNEFKELQELYKNQENIILNNSNENLWFTWWNNFNLKLILNNEYKYILLLNNDTIIPENFLNNFLDSIRGKNVFWIFWPEIRNKDDTIQSIWNSINLYTWWGKRYKSYDKVNKVDYISWSCFFIDNEVIKKIWILDDLFFAYYEESDFCMRAKKAWFHTYIIPNIYIYHKEETANKKDKPYYCYLMFRNRILFLKKHCNYLQYFISYLFLIWYLLFLFPKIFWAKNYKFAFKWIKDWVKWIWWNINF